MYGFRGYRMLAAPILFTIGLAIAFQWRWVLVTLVLYLVAAAPYTIEYYRLFNAFQTSDERREQIELLSQQYAEVIPFDPDTSNPWCNTITLDLFYLFGETSVAVAVPAGVGISIPETVWNSGEFPLPPKTHYIGLPVARYEQLRDQLNVEPLLDIPGGKIYLNLDSPCEAATQPELR
jgi:hypothetical protein